MGKALEVLGAESLQFGSDCFLPCSGAQIAERMGWVHDLLDELEVGGEARARIWGGTAAAWLGLDTSSPVADDGDGAGRFGDRPMRLQDVCC